MDKVLVAAHDAGGAEIISSWIKHHPGFHYTFVLNGPAKAIFKRKLGEIIIYEQADLEFLVPGQDTVLTGTSWVSFLEREALLYGNNGGKHTISYLDHWCDYAERFHYQGGSVLPRELWVGDAHGLAIANTIFPDKKITYVENCYFKDIQLEFAAVIQPRAMTSTIRILYICEPIADYAEKQFGSADYFNYTEFEALDYFFSHLKKCGDNHCIESIKIRLHPSESRNKYDAIVRNQARNDIRISEASLIEDVAWADWVVGCSSMVLVQSLLANKKVFTCIPPGAKVFRLPYPDIKDIPERILL